MTDSSRSKISQSGGYTDRILWMCSVVFQVISLAYAFKVLAASSMNVASFTSRFERPLTS